MCHFVCLRNVNKNPARRVSWTCQNMFACPTIFSTLRWHRWLKHFHETDKNPFILHNCYGRWCPGDVRNRGINSHGIDQFILKYSDFSTKIRKLGRFNASILYYIRLLRKKDIYIIFLSACEHGSQFCRVLVETLTQNKTAHVYLINQV